VALAPLQRMRGIPEFPEHVRGRTDYETRIERSGAAGCR
jgi:hypothetical protein